jgi:hypothetical protein
MRRDNGISRGEPVSGFVISCPVPDNDTPLHIPESENLGPYFGNGHSGAMPTCNSATGGSTSPITGLAMGMVGSFSEL